jgi:hypothetical protein
MSICVEFPEPKAVIPSKGTAGLKSQLGGCPTTVSALMEAGKNIGNASLVKKDIG